MDKTRKVLIIIPAYNESESIEQVIGRITAHQQVSQSADCELRYDYLIVNDVLEECVAQVHQIIQ